MLSSPADLLRHNNELIRIGPISEIPPDEARQDLDEPYLKTLARALPSHAAHFLTIAAHHHHPKREAFLHMSFQKVRGGYLDRTCDGPPGWQTLWKGWMRKMNAF